MARGSSATDEPTDPEAGDGRDGTPPPATAAAPAAANAAPADAEPPVPARAVPERHTLRDRLVRRAILPPIAFVLAVVVGVLSVTSLLTGSAKTAQTDTHPT